MRMRAVGAQAKDRGRGSVRLDAHDDEVAGGREVRVCLLEQAVNARLGEPHQVAAVLVRAVEQRRRRVLVRPRERADHPLVDDLATVGCPGRVVQRCARIGAADVEHALAPAVDADEPDRRGPIVVQFEQHLRAVGRDHRIDVLSAERRVGEHVRCPRAADLDHEPGRAVLEVVEPGPDGRLDPGRAVGERRGLSGCRRHEDEAEHGHQRGEYADHGVSIDARVPRRSRSVRRQHRAERAQRIYAPCVVRVARPAPVVTWPGAGSRAPRRALRPDPGGRSPPDPGAARPAAGRLSRR